MACLMISKLAVSLVLVAFSSLNADPVYPPIEPAQQATAMRILSMDVKDMQYCEQDNDCNNPGKPVCHQMSRLCKSVSEAGFDFIYGSCQSNADCQPMYRCQDTKCHFSGPRACESENDCLAGLGYACKNLQRSAPGKRCWLKCTKDRDCHQCDETICRIPDEFRTKITCCEGFCQRKIACEDSPTP